MGEDIERVLELDQAVVGRSLEIFQRPQELAKFAETI
jgi:hypothetical protein